MIKEKDFPYINWPITEGEKHGEMPALQVDMHIVTQIRYITYYHYTPHIISDNYLDLGIS